MRRSATLIAILWHSAAFGVSAHRSFELVDIADGAVIYVEDHGKPMHPPA
jgi:hypothetical protein